MKVLMINGSPRANGNTTVCLNEMKKIFEAADIETEIIQIGNKDIRGCIACNSCKKTGKCVFDDAVNEAAPKFEATDGLVVAAPVYCGSPNGTMISFLDRLFYSTSFDKTMKVGAALAVARRGGLSASIDVFNKYFELQGMPIATGQYWTGIHGLAKGEAEQDGEGLQQARTLARNMAFLMKAIADAKEKYGLPEKEQRITTNFVR